MTTTININFVKTTVNLYKVSLKVNKKNIPESKINTSNMTLIKWINKIKGLLISLKFIEFKKSSVGFQFILKSVIICSGYKNNKCCLVYWFIVSYALKISYIYSHNS